ncbi:MAG: hypothetical protein AAF518_07940 [Spirochaetota bacterium]
MQAKTKQRMKYSFVVLVILFSLTAIPAKGHKSVQFIAIGDTPYTQKEDVRLQQVVAKAITRAKVPFLVHYGDFKSGALPCTKKLMRQSRDRIYGLLPGRVFYTPGDNEWTDCDRAKLKPAVSELASLSLIRRLFFRKKMRLPKSWKYQRQPNFPENARWMYKGIFFTTLHMVSTNNGRIDIQRDDVEYALAMVEARDAANRVWLEESFSLAIKAKAKAMVLVTQADVTDPDGSGACTANHRMHCDAFKSFRQHLRQQAGNFSQRGKSLLPVLLVHGDTNAYCWDRRFGGTKAPNLWRLNAWGDFADPADATVIGIDWKNRKSPFSAKTLVEGHKPAKSCRKRYP